MSLGGFQACPWCAFVGTPHMFDIHMDKEHNEGELRRTHDQDILEEIFEERLRQDDKWGEQNHPDGTGSPWLENTDYRWSAVEIADWAKQQCNFVTRDSKSTWADIALEEIAEAFAETDEVLIRAELVQSAAVLVNWIGAIDRRAILSRNNQQENEKGNDSEPKG